MRSTLDLNHYGAATGRSSTASGIDLGRSISVGGVGSLGLDLPRENAVGVEGFGYKLWGAELPGMGNATAATVETTRFGFGANWTHTFDRDGAPAANFGVAVDIVHEDASTRVGNTPGPGTSNWTGYINVGLSF